MNRESQHQRLLAYVADLELEVDRLRRHDRHLHQEVLAALDHVQDLCKYPVRADDPPAPLAEVARAAARLGEVMRELRDPPGYHPAHDQVSAVAVRPIAQQVFRWQQRLQGAAGVALQLNLEIDHIEWFPARFRHILDSLLSNALKYRDPGKAEARVNLALRALPEGYELRVSDNGVGMPGEERGHLFDLFYRTAAGAGSRPGRRPGRGQSPGGAERRDIDIGLR